VDRVVPVFEESVDHAGLALAWRLRFGMYGTTGQYGKAAEAAEKEIDHARLAGDFRLQTRGATGYAHSVKYGPTPVPEAIVRCERLVEEVRADRRSVAAIQASLAQLYAMRGEFDRARATYASSRAMLEELGGGVLSASTSLDSSCVEMLAGDYAAAERELRRDFDALSAMGERFLLSTVAGRLARAVELQGRPDDALELTKTAEELSSADDADAQALWRAVRARALAHLGDLEPAITLATEAVALRRRGDAPVDLAEALADLAEVSQVAHQPEVAEAALAEALELVDHKGDIVTAERLRQQVALVAS